MADVHKNLLADFPKITHDAWRERVDKDLKGTPFDKLISRTLDGLPIAPLYTEDDVAGIEPGLPGLPPYRRLGHALGRGDARWDMRQRHVHPDPSVVAQDIAQDLSRGVTSLWLRLDHSARLGLATAKGDGMLCPDLMALSHALGAVKLDTVGISLDAGANALPAAALFFAYAEQSSTPLVKLRGALNCDPLSALARDGALPSSLADNYRQQAALAAFCLERAPGLRAVAVSTEPYHNAGASPAQELAFSLATGVDYLRKLTEHGLSLDAAATQMVFTVCIGSDFFAEIAKLRALRQCWSSVVAACGGSAQAQRATIQATTSNFTKTTRDPYVNMLRITTEAFAAAVGGVDALATEGFDAPFGPSESFARRIASNAQVVLNEESHVAQVGDPAGGAYYIESLTDALAEDAYRRFQAIEAKGGMEAALLGGHILQAIQEIAAIRNRDLARRKQAITGVSEYANIHEASVARKPVDLVSLSARVRLDEKGADLDLRGEGLTLVNEVLNAASHGANMQSLTRSLASHEACATMDPLPSARQAQAYEALRDRSDSHTARTGERPSVFLCNLGPIPKHKARASFATGLVHAGGLATVDNDGFATVEAAAKAFAAAGTPVAIICGSDDQYPEWVSSIAPSLKAAGARYLVLAGRPSTDLQAQFRSAGIDDFIFMGCDVPATVDMLMTQLGVL